MNTVNSLLAFVAGAAAGAVIALVCAPDSGEKTREKIRTGVSGMAGKAKDKILGGLDKVESALEKK